MHEVKKILKFLPVHIIDPRISKEESYYISEELESLIRTLGGIISDRVIQKMERPDNRTFIGKGKLIDVENLVAEKNIDIVVLSKMAKSRQIHAIRTKLQKTKFNIEVWDRVDLILNIFDKHAHTTEAKLQIELAKMKYMGPRIYGMGFIMSQQGGGIGTLGVGETNTELMKRHWREQIKKVTQDLDKANKTRQSQLDFRKRKNYKTVSIAGYTNAGKSSLFNLLTNKNTYVENELFATLDSSVGKIFLKNINTEVLLTDTIGFIRDLPARLIDSFKSTLMESVNSDLLIHLIDSSDPEVDTKIKVVNEILTSLNIDLAKTIYVFNKIDLLEKNKAEELSNKYKHLECVFISTFSNKGIDVLKNKISDRISMQQ